MALPPSRTVAAGELLQHLSRTTYRGQALHFGQQGLHRYDAPNCSYGVLYLSFDLATALMESVFHRHRWHRQASRSIALTEVRIRMVRAVGVVRDLVLADLTAQGVMAQHFGLNLGQLASRRYGPTRQLSAAVHGLCDDEGTPAFDGLIYPSQQFSGQLCCAVRPGRTQGTCRGRPRPGGACRLAEVRCRLAHRDRDGCWLTSI